MEIRAISLISPTVYDNTKKKNEMVKRNKETDIFRALLFHPFIFIFIFFCFILLAITKFGNMYVIYKKDSWIFETTYTHADTFILLNNTRIPFYKEQEYFIVLLITVLHWQHT